VSTRIVDRYGEPYPTNDVRRRLGFLGGDHLPVDSGGECYAPDPRPREIPVVNEMTGDEYFPPECKRGVRR
jgi:hypothetical protein